MKTKTLFYMALMAVMTTLAACSQDDELMDAAPKQAPIEFEITDGGFADVQTRAVEEGFRTKFEAGDVCGLYIVRDGALVAENVELKASEGEDGTITWQVVSGDISGAAKGDKCFLYCPYNTMGMINKVNPNATDSDDAFFAKGINEWNTAFSQDSYEYYRNNDLMTAAGEVKDGDGKLKVSFSLNHKMALAVIEVPKTKYNFTNITDGAEYTVPTRVDFSGEEVKPCQMADGTYRLIFNPQIVQDYINNVGTLNIKGKVPDGKTFTISVDKIKDIANGTYKTFRIGGGADGTPIEKSHELQVGDYLLKDGNLIKKDETLTAAQKADVAAIVFYAPNISERETPASLTDDKIMAAEHPNCNHGLAVAVQELTYQGSNTMAWQTTAENVESFRKSSNFTHTNKDNFTDIASGTTNKDNISKIYGYQNTQVLFAYNDYCTKNSKTDNIVKPAAAIEGFTDVNPAPKGSTGWFIPSGKELHILCYKDGNTVLDSGKNHTVTRDKVNESLTAVGGVVFGDGYYWSSSEFSNSNNSQFYANFSNAGFFNPDKTTGCLVRCVCAF